MNFTSTPSLLQRILHDLRLLDRHDVVPVSVHQKHRCVVRRHVGCRGSVAVLPVFEVVEPHGRTRKLWILIRESHESRESSGNTTTARKEMCRKICRCEQCYDCLRRRLMTRGRISPGQGLDLSDNRRSMRRNCSGSRYRFRTGREV